MSNNYAGLRRAMGSDREAAERAARRLIAMRDRLAPLRAEKRSGALMLATWNIRDFDSNRFGWGLRRPESYYYLAEIMA